MSIDTELRTQLDRQVDTLRLLGVRILGVADVANGRPEIDTVFPSAGPVIVFRGNCGFNADLEERTISLRSLAGKEGMNQDEVVQAFEELDALLHEVARRALIETPLANWQREE